MEEIKFKGKRVDNGEWVKGNLIKDTVNGKTFINVEYDSTDGMSPVSIFQVISETVGQFTGLHDKNETEIFEGDILKYFFETKRTIGPPYIESKNAGYELWEIQYIPPSFVKIIIEQGNSYYGKIPSEPRVISLNYLDASKIFGNIHDSPRVIKNE